MILVDFLILGSNILSFFSFVNIVNLGSEKGGIDIWVITFMMIMSMVENV